MPVEPGPDLLRPVSRLAKFDHQVGQGFNAQVV